MKQIICQHMKKIICQYISNNLPIYEANDLSCEINLKKSNTTIQRLRVGSFPTLFFRSVTKT